jgi:hypothetical protein
MDLHRMCKSVCVKSISERVYVCSRAKVCFIYMCAKTTQLGVYKLYQLVPKGVYWNLSTCTQRCRTVCKNITTCPKRVYKNLCV